MLCVQDFSSVQTWYHTYVYVGKIGFAVEGGGDQIEMLKISLWAFSLNCDENGWGSQVSSACSTQTCINNRIKVLVEEEAVWWKKPFYHTGAC